MSYDVAEKRISDIYQELRLLEKAIEQIPSSLAQDVQKHVQGKLGDIRQGREKDPSLEELGRKITEIDERLQSTVVLDPRAKALIKAKKGCQEFFAKIFDRYHQKLSGTSKKFPKYQKGLQKKQSDQIADLAIGKALKKVLAEEIATKAREGSVPSVPQLLRFAKEPSALYALYQTCKALLTIPTAHQNQESTMRTLAQGFLQLPFALRQDLIRQLKIEEPSTLDSLRKEIGEDGDMQQLAASLAFLNSEERSLLLTRLENSFDPKHFGLAHFVAEFEKQQKHLAQTVALRGSGSLLKALEAMAVMTVEDSQIEDWEGFLPQSNEKRAAALIKETEGTELHEILKQIGEQEIESALAAKPKKEEALLGIIEKTEQERTIVFEQFYANVLVVLHQSDSESQKREAALALIQKLPETMRNQFFGKIFELNPHRKLKKQWGEKHALDNWGILLDAAAAFCAPKKEHPLRALFEEMQKIVHNRKFTYSADFQRAVQELLKKYKKEVPIQTWDQFKEQFFKRFPGQEKWQWGFGGEESRAHNFPYHSLLTLQGIIVHSSRSEYWEAMKTFVHVRYGKDDGIKASTKPSLDESATLWQCYNAIEGYRQASMFGKLQQKRFFPKMWQMSPLCQGLKSGRDQAIDPTKRKEIIRRLKLLELLDRAKQAINGHYTIDQPVWETLIHRIILQEAPLKKKEVEGISRVIKALQDLAKDPTYDPIAAKEILQLLIDMSSRRVSIANLKQVLSLKEVQQFAYSTALQAKPLDHTGPTMYKPLTFFKDETGKFLGKLKPLDTALGNNGNYKVEHFFREIASSHINDALGFDITVPTTAFRFTLGEAIRKLAEHYRVEPQSADRIFASMHPLLREAIERRLGSAWNETGPREKSSVLQAFYEKTGTTDLLHLIVEKLSEDLQKAEVLSLVAWLPVHTKYAIYKQLKRLLNPKGRVSSSFGQLAFHDLKGFSSSSAQKIQAIQAIEQYETATGLKHTYAEEGLGSLQPWAQDVETIMDVLKSPDGAKRLSDLPKERVDLYSLLHILKSEGDSYPGNTLLSKSGHFIDCDEEHALQPYNHYDLQLMGELGWPQSKEPVKPLLLHLILHPYFRETCQDLSQQLLVKKDQDHALIPFKKQIAKSFEEPFRSFKERIEKIQNMAAEGIAGSKQHSVRDMFFAIYDDYERGGIDQYKKFLEDPALQDRAATFFEIYLGKKAKFGAPACLQRWDLPGYVHYPKNIRDLSESQLDKTT